MHGGGIDESVRARIAALPLFAGRALDGWRFEPLDGLTNRTVKLSRGGESYVVRLPGRGTGRYIDRAQEGHNARIAVAIGLCPEILFFDPRDGTMVTRFVENAAALDGGRLRDPAMLRTAVGTLARLHRSGRAFRGEMRLFPKLDDYLALAKGAGPRLVAELRAARTEAEPVRAALQRDRESLAPCHIDPAPHNFIAKRQAGGPRTGLRRIYLLDWEYSAMCEPMWDLAGLSTEGGFDADRDAAMLSAYYGDASAARTRRMVLYKAALDLLAAAWGAVQVADGNAGADVRLLVRERLGRFRRATDRTRSPFSAPRL